MDINTISAVSIPFRPAIGSVITDTRTGTKYVLRKVIGFCEEDLVYKAWHYSINGGLLSSGYVTVKFIRPGDEVKWSREQESEPTRNLINVKSWCISGSVEGFCVALPYMSEGSLRYILSKRFHRGFPEDLIVTVLNEALIGLGSLHDLGRVHKRFSAGNILVHVNSSIPKVEIKLSFAASIYESDLDMNVYEDTDLAGPSVPDLMMVSEWASAPEVFYNRYNGFHNNDLTLSQAIYQDELYYTVKSDIWLVGIAALELAYGNIRVTHRKEFDNLIQKIKSAKKLPRRLEDLLEKIMAEESTGKMKKVVKLFKDKLKITEDKIERVFSDEFEEFVLDCLSNKPRKRPTVTELLNRPLFFNCRSLKWFDLRALRAKNTMPDLLI